MSYGDQGPAKRFLKDSPNPAWWDSPDIFVPGNQVNAGANTIQVCGRKVDTLPSSGVATVEAFISTPGLVMNPPKPYNTPYTQPLGSVDIPNPQLKLAADPSVANGSIPFTVPGTVTDKDDAFGPGHRCVIARIFNFGFNPPTSVFDPPNEDHEAQKNVAVVGVTVEGGGGGAAGAGQGAGGAAGAPPAGMNEFRMFEFRLDTTTRRAKAEDVVFRAAWANRHPAAELKSLVARLRERREFKRLMPEPPARFAFRFDLPKDDLPHAEGQRPYIPNVLGVKDRSSGGENPFYEAKANLRPRRMARLGLVADLSRTPIGGADVFYVQQLGADRSRQGGMTVVFLRVG